MIARGPLGPFGFCALLTMRADTAEGRFPI